MLDARRLRVLIEVVERGSFSAAAEALHLTQPSVSRHVATLEREVGVSLLQRNARGVLLTHEGAALVERGKDIVARLDAAELHLHALSGLITGRVRIAAFASANAALVPAVVREFSTRYPQVQVALSATPPETHPQAIHDGELDLALVTDWDVPRVPRVGVRLVHIVDDEPLLALPRAHRLASAPSIALVDLRDEVWIEGAHPDCLGPLGRLCQRDGYEPLVGYTCDDWTGKKALVAAGVGITLFPSLALADARPDIVLRRLDEPLPPRRVYALAPEPPYHAPSVPALLEVLSDVARALQPRVLAQRS
ncbi:MAG TPA: LysR family transcriptional regulator [Solirubrobacteraceae bacterium]|jgi:DNA-binding transcriptional LysR family regulator|nr:LysR family transcriptional regulator [Solirubrobacteraceae bacterium]